jgi:hypothetical protein
MAGLRPLPSENKESGMQTSGLILDVYDDFNGDVIRSLFPSRDSLPELVKEADALSSIERDLLPDDAFALVLLNGEEKLRKFACTDSGNTALSVLYFLENGHKLPEEAQKTAAANLEVACGWYDLPVKGLEKIALLGWAARTAVEHPWRALNAAMVVPGAVHDAKENQKAISEIQNNEGWSEGSRPISPGEVKEHRMMKAAELGQLAPVTQTTGPAAPSKAPGISKGGSAMHLKGHGTDVLPDTNLESSHVRQKAPDAAPQARVMHPHVEVHHLSAKGTSTEKKASVYALNGRYPLDSYEQVKTASAYFDDFGKRMPPADRREFCVNLLARAEDLNIKVAETVRHYGGTELASDAQLKVARDLRAAILEEPAQLDMLNAIFEKRAELGAELFLDTLVEFDKMAGLDYLYDSDVPDPFYSLFYKAAEEEYSYVDGNDMITEEDLRRLSKVGTKAIKHTFGEDFMTEFQKDPVGIFKSMPNDQKRMVMHMANDNSAPGIALLA